MTPLFFEEEDLTLLSRMVGTIVIAWGQVEAAINLAVNMLHGTKGDKAGEEIPVREFSRRVRFLKDTARKALPPEIHEPLRVLLIEATRIGVVRDMLVHGYASGMDRKTSIITFTRFDPQKGGHAAVDIRYSLHFLHVLADETIKLASDLARLNQLIDPYFPKNPAD